MLDAALQPFESNLCLAVLREPNGPNDNALANVAIAAHVNLHGDPILAAADAAREAGNAPNSVLAAAASILGPRRVAGCPGRYETLLDLFRAGSSDAQRDEASTWRHRARRRPFSAPRRDPRAAALLAALDARGAKSVFVRYVRGLGDTVTADAVLAAIAPRWPGGRCSARRISRRTALNLPWHLALYGTLIGASVPAGRHEAGAFCGVPTEEILRSWTATELAGLALTGRRPGEAELFSYQVLLGLLLTNGPGTISAQGAKGAVSADGPESPERVQINKAMVGFLTHTGFSHGGNGFEGIQFLLEQFQGVSLEDPAGAGHGLDVRAMATALRPGLQEGEGASGARPRATARGRSPASITPCFAASRSTPTRARPLSVG